MITARPGLWLLAGALLAASVLPSAADTCKREGSLVTCDDGRVGTFAGDAIIWNDGTTSRAASQHPSVIIGNRPSVHVGPGVFVGKGNGGVVPLENPNAPNKRTCAILDGISYCH